MPQFRVSEAYRRPATSPRRSTRSAESIQRGDQFQTLLGATGTGKTATMAWIAEQVQKPTLVIAHNKTLAAQLCNEFREFLPGERRRVLRLLLRLLPARGVRPPGRSLHREGRVDQRRHRPAPPRGDGGAPGAQGRAHRRVRLLHLRHRLARGVRGEDGRCSAIGPGDRPRRDAAEARRHPVRAQRLDPRPRALPRARRRRRGAAGAHGVGLPHLVLRRRGRADHALRPALGRDLRPPRAPRHLPGDAVRDLARDDRARGRRDPARARGAGQALRVAGQAPRGAPDPPADRVRPGDAAGARLLQRDRELLADPRRPRAGHGAAHAARLLPRRLPRPHRRVAPDRAADRRHVRGRPLAQGDARRARLPASVGARQPAAALRRVPRARAAAALRLGDARARSSCATRRTSPSRSSARPASSTRRSSCARRRTRSTTSSTRSAAARRRASACS